MKEIETIESQFVGINVAVTILGVTRKTLYNMEDSGRLSRYIVLGKPCFLLSELQEIVNNKNANNAK
jgi:predicted DNA-binding transcriptional regulator AlpA